MVSPLSFSLMLRNKKKYIIQEEVKTMQNTVITPMADEVANVSQEKKAGTRKDYDSWDYALGLASVDGLSPSPDVLALAEREKRGEITTADIKKYLDRKYKVNGRD
jgi:hypothetical protein